MEHILGSDTGIEKGRVFELAAELFGVLATPMRLRILSALCDKEKSVSQLLQEIDTTQPNLSQHLNLLYRAGVLAKPDGKRGDTADRADRDDMARPLREPDDPRHHRPAALHCHHQPAPPRHVLERHPGVYHARIASQTPATAPRT